MRIILITFAILASSLSQSAHADNWIGLALSTDGTELLADPDSLKPIMGDRVAIWTYRKGGPFFTLKDGRVRHSYRTRYFADCSRNQVGTNEAIWYDAEGKTLNRYLWPVPEMEPITPNTNGESVFLFACDPAHRSKQTEWYESFGAPKVKAP